MATGAAVFDAHPHRSSARQPAANCAALVESADQSVILRLNGPAGVGITALLDGLARTADATGTATVLRTPEQPTTTRPTSPGCSTSPPKLRSRLRKHHPLLGSFCSGGARKSAKPSMSPPPHLATPRPGAGSFRADRCAGWIAPGPTDFRARTRLRRLMADDYLTLQGRRYGWAPDLRHTVTDIADAPEARSEFDQAANEQAWSRLLDIQASEHLPAGDPTHTTWLDLVGMLADRLPRDVPMHMLADRATPRTPPSADALYHRGVRALRRQQHDVARQLFEGYLARVEQPKERALGVCNRRRGLGLATSRPTSTSSRPVDLQDG